MFENGKAPARRRRPPPGRPADAAGGDFIRRTLLAFGGHPPTPIRETGDFDDIERVLRSTAPFDLWEMRLMIEPQIARLAAIRGTDQEIEKLAAIHARSKADVFDLDLDVAFHRGISVASHNALAVHFLELITELTFEGAFRTRCPPLTSETGYRDHAAIVAAMLGRDAEAAETAMLRHVTAIILWLRGASRLPGPS